LSKFNNFKNYNPDILETIANLSNDEVFTPPKLANEILDLLPEEVWSDSTITFLDPAVKTGIFLREIASRLIDGLAEEIPDLQERVNHILTKQVFGIGITELTTLMARRTVYCSTTANGPYSICTEFDDEKGNIIFPNTEHTWDKDGRCEYCGANKDSYGGEVDRESYAYPFIHDNFEKEFGNMKFDVIIGNPPYQLSTNSSGHQALPLYNKFIEKSKELSPRYISMIIPSRWMKGGMGLNSFREEMIKDTRLKEIHDFQNSKDIFPELDIDGGICYFLWDNKHKSKVKYHYTDMVGHHDVSNRYLKVPMYSKVIRDSRQLSIISKSLTKTKNIFTSIVATGGSFGFNSYLFDEPERYPNVTLLNEEKEDFLLIHGVTGKAGGSKRLIKYINEDSVIRNRESIYKYKLFFSKAYTSTSTVPPEVIRAGPGVISTDTFIKIGNFNTEEEMNNCLTYIKTKFFRALLFYNRHSLHISKNSFELIPLQDFSKPWTDEELYKKYKLTQEEIDYIEDNIDPMD